jgi:purine-binding chemotaxis protein CheW
MDGMNQIIGDEAKITPEEKQKKIDFKMVTFSLAGRDYGIDIMKVKEISKVSRFTYVPNTFPFVRGVHNLRGEIISIIDMRQMFNLSFERMSKEKNYLENILILNLKENKIGVIVDSISKVVGISSETIQPPPPLFREINVEYINGVVDYDDHLYIILDIDRIFQDDIDESGGNKKEIEQKPTSEKAIEKPVKAEVLDIQFISETLKALAKFYVKDLNKAWVTHRLDDWKKECSQKGRDFQLENIEDAEAFLSPFFSPCTGMFYDESYKNEFVSILPDIATGSVNIWNAGCGKGFESYSIAVIAKVKYAGARIKIWANDINLLDISTAPNIVLNKDSLPHYFLDGPFITETPKGYQFGPEIKDAIYFEYHDVLNQNTVPQIDIIVMRDLLSFLKPTDQERLVKEFIQKLKPGGFLIIGKNEVLSDGNFEVVKGNNIVGYRKRDNVR